MVVKWQIPIRFSDKPKIAAYKTPEKCNTEAGEVLVSSNLRNNYSMDEIAATLGHELYHAFQVLEKGYSCGCSQEKELEAAIVAFATLRYLGRDDILDAKWSGLWDKGGNFGPDVLWDAIQSAYSHCPKYEPR